MLITEVTVLPTKLLTLVFHLFSCCALLVNFAHGYLGVDLSAII